MEHVLKAIIIEILRSMKTQLIFDFSDYFVAGFLLWIPPNSVYLRNIENDSYVPFLLLEDNL